MRNSSPSSLIAGWAAAGLLVRRQRIVFPPHFLDRCVYFAHGVAERHEGILQAIWAAYVHTSKTSRQRSTIRSTGQRAGVRSRQTPRQSVQSESNTI